MQLWSQLSNVGWTIISVLREWYNHDITYFLVGGFDTSLRVRVSQFLWRDEFGKKHAVRLFKEWNAFICGSPDHHRVPLPRQPLLERFQQHSSTTQKKTSEIPNKKFCPQSSGSKWNKRLDGCQAQKASYKRDSERTKRWKQILFVIVEAHFWNWFDNRNW